MARLYRSWPDGRVDVQVPGGWRVVRQAVPSLERAKRDGVIVLILLGAAVFYILRSWATFRPLGSTWRGSWS